MTLGANGLVPAVLTTCQAGAIITLCISDKLVMMQVFVLVPLGLMVLFLVKELVFRAWEGLELRLEELFSA